MSLLQQLVAEVREREGGAVIDGTPIPQSYREAVRYMTHRLYLRSTRYRDQLWRANLSRLDPDAHEFARAYQAFMSNVGIPIVVDVVGSAGDQNRWFVLGLSESAVSHLPIGRSMAFTHAIRGDKLTPICWQVFEHVGLEVAKKLGLGVQWGGPTTPWQWVVDP